MNKNTYTQLLANPQELSIAQMGSLAAVIEQYPFMQSARALQLKGFKNANSFQYNDALKVTAAYTTDRNILFSYITSQHFTQNEISNEILKHNTAWNDLEVEIEDVSAAVENEKGIQYKGELEKAEAILSPHLFEKKEQIKAMIEIAASNEKETLNENQNPTKEQSSVDNVEDENTIENTPSIKPNAPLEFDKSDTHSFSEWLKLSQAKPIDRNKNKGSGEKISEVKALSSTDEKKEQKFDLIDKFIQDKPKIIPKDKSEAIKNIELAVSSGPKALMTETLAKVYLQQGNHDKAIQSYKILILKYPEKSGFFADQIRAIKKLTNNI